MYSKQSRLKFGYNYKAKHTLMIHIQQQQSVTPPPSSTTRTVATQIHQADRCSTYRFKPKTIFLSVSYMCYTHNTTVGVPITYFPLKYIPRLCNTYFTNFWCHPLFNYKPYSMWHLSSSPQNVVPFFLFLLSRFYLAVRWVLLILRCQNVIQCSYVTALMKQNTRMHIGNLLEKQ